MTNSDDLLNGNGDDGEDTGAWSDGIASFATFLHALAGSGQLSLTAMEVPLDVFIEAKAEGVLQNLEIARDEYGLPFLMGIVESGEHRAVLVSVSFAPAPTVDETGPDEDGGDGE
jgi:hypothetical protein